MVLQSLRVLFALLLSCGTALATAREHGAFYFIGIGCLPYSRVAQIEQQLARLTEAVNAANPSFIVHMGDINGGDEPASDARFTYIKNWFNSFEAPLIYTPGDNEWTDAHRPAIGGYDPLERLARIRSYFFSEEKSFGRNPIPLETQRTQSGFDLFVENAMWEKNGVLFATIHVVGSFNNNQPSIPGAVEEFKERNAANLAWLQQVFSRASALDAPGVALFIQAQPFAHTWNMPGFMPGFREFLESLAAHAREYGRPVLLAHADEHRYRLDYGIAISSGAQNVPNLIRLGTFGDHDIHGVIVLVDPSSPEVFAPGPFIVPGNNIPRIRR